MPEYTVPIDGPNGPGFMTVNASDPQQAAINASQGGNHATDPTGGNAIAGGHQAHTGGGGTAVAGGLPPSTPSGPTFQASTGDQGMQQYIQAWQQIMQAVADRDEKAFQEAIRQFDLYYGLDRDRFAEDVRQFNQTFGLQQAAVTGQYQGAPTLAAQNQAFQQGSTLIGQVAGLQANPFRQQAAMGQMNRLLGGQGVAGFGGIGQVPGAGTGGLGYLQQMIDDIRDPNANTTAMNEVLAGIPTPNKLNSVDFFRSPQTTQNMVLEGMSEKYGIDPNDALQQIRNTMPGFRAPSTFGQVRR